MTKNRGEEGEERKKNAGPVKTRAGREKKIGPGLRIMRVQDYIRCSKSRFVNLRPAYFYERKLFFLRISLDDRFPF